MTLWGSSSAYRSGLNEKEEWDRIQTLIKNLNGGYGMQIRRSYKQDIISNFSQAAFQAGFDYQRGIVSAMSIRPTQTADAGWLNTINGNHDAAIKSLVNSTPTDHTMYLIYSHEPENDGGHPATYWRQAWARFAKVVLSCGKSNVIPTFNLMGWTFQSASGRNPNDYNPARHMTAAEAAACVGSIDGYGDDQPYSRTPSATFGGAYNDVMSWGFRGFGIGECGVLNVAGRGDWMTALQTWVNARSDVEFVCWWHAEDPGYVTYLDSPIGNDPTSFQVWANIIASEQGGTPPSTPPPSVELPPGSGGNATGTPIVVSNNSGGYAISGGTSIGEFSRITYSQEEGWPPGTGDIAYQADFSHPVVAVWADGSATVAWEGDFGVVDEPENAYYYQTWARDYTSGNYTSRPEPYVIASTAWEWATPAHVRDDVAWWCVSVDGLMQYVRMPKGGSAEYFDMPTNVGDIAHYEIFPYSSTNAYLFGEYRPFSALGYSRMGCWDVDSSGAAILIGSHIYAYEYYSPDPPPTYVDFSFSPGQYSVDLNKGIWMYFEGNGVGWSYVSFEINDGAFEVVHQGVLEADTGEVITPPYGYPAPLITSKGTVLTSGYTSSTSSTHVAYELTFGDSAVSIVNSAVYPEATGDDWGGYFAYFIETPTGYDALYAGALLLENFHHFIHWQNIFTTSTTTEIAHPTTSYESSFAYEYFCGTYPWVTMNYLYEQTIEEVEGDYWFNNSAWVSVMGSLPDLDGELTEKRQKFARGPTDYSG